MLRELRRRAIRQKKVPGKSSRQIEEAGQDKGEQNLACGESQVV